MKLCSKLTRPLALLLHYLVMVVLLQNPLHQTFAWTTTTTTATSTSSATTRTSPTARATPSTKRRITATRNWSKKLASINIDPASSLFTSLSSSLSSSSEARTTISDNDEEENRDLEASSSSSVSPPAISIRDCSHMELGQVADIILNSFYTEEQRKSPWRQMYRLGELNRLQQAFSYGDDKSMHRMLVATTKPSKTTTTKAITPSNNNSNNDNIIVGFVDVDARPPNHKHTQYRYNPRPYLSDLCIHPDYRRLGVASKLIGACEEFCLELEDAAKQQLYIRVERHNLAAVKMYQQRLGYEEVFNPDDPYGETSIILLHKLLDQQQQVQGTD